jgi:hypothetical protein
MKGIKSSRRRFLLSFFGLGLLALARPHLAWTGVAKQIRYSPLTSQLEELLKHTKSAVIIGRQYLRLAPQEREPQVLLNLISLSCGESVFDLNSDKLRECLRLQTRQDFAEGHIIKMHGWMLSITEARFCALAAQVFLNTQHRPKP